MKLHLIEEIIKKAEFGRDYTVTQNLEGKTYTILSENLKKKVCPFHESVTAIRGISGLKSEELDGRFLYQYERPNDEYDRFSIIHNLETQEKKFEEVSAPVRRVIERVEGIESSVRRALEISNAFSSSRNNNPEELTIRTYREGNRVFEDIQGSSQYRQQQRELPRN